jgi:hypothetical protein
MAQADTKAAWGSDRPCAAFLIGVNMHIKNWHDFQHYKHRNPPWIKLHRTLLNDRQWHELDAPAAKCLITLWLIAAERDGELPPLKDLAFRCRMSESSMKSIVSKLEHWIVQDASNVLADCKHVAPESILRDRVKTELSQSTELSTELECGVSNEFETFWTHYPKKIGKKEALKAWDKAKDKPAIDDIVRLIASFKSTDQWTKENGQFIPNPATWLNQGRWADQPIQRKLSTVEKFLARHQEEA